jgi:hypothetical protein
MRRQREACRWSGDVRLSSENADVGAFDLLRGITVRVDAIARIGRIGVRADTDRLLGRSRGRAVWPDSMVDTTRPRRGGMTGHSGLPQGTRRGGRPKTCEGGDDAEDAMVMPLREFAKEAGEASPPSTL